MILSLIILGVSLAILVKCCDMLLKSTVRIGTYLRTPPIFLSFLVIGLGTSLPELFVAIQSGFAGSPLIAAGNLLGASFIDISFIFGVALVAFRSIRLDLATKENLLIPLLGMTAPLIFLSDGVLSRTDGISNLVLFGIISYWLLAVNRERHVKESNVSLRDYFASFALLAASLAGIVVTSRVAVLMTQSLVAELHVSELLFASLVLGLGTTLPELIIVFRAKAMRYPLLALGDVFGSVTVNMNLILGILALIGPVKFQTYQLIPITSFIALTGILLVVWSSFIRKLSWVLGVMLVVLYAAFALLSGLLLTQ